METTLQIISTTVSELGTISIKAEEVYTNNGKELFRKQLNYSTGLEEDVSDFPQEVKDRITLARTAFSQL